MLRAVRKQFAKCAVCGKGVSRWAHYRGSCVCTRPPDVEMMPPRNVEPVHAGPDDSGPDAGSVDGYSSAGGDSDPGVEPAEARSTFPAHDRTFKYGEREARDGHNQAFPHRSLKHLLIYLAERAPVSEARRSTLRMQVLNHPWVKTSESVPNEVRTLLDEGDSLWPAPKVL
jgi:hypothetical protein